MPLAVVCYGLFCGDPDCVPEAQLRHSTIPILSTSMCLVLCFRLAPYAFLCVPFW